MDENIDGRQSNILLQGTAQETTPPLSSALLSFDPYSSLLLHIRPQGLVGVSEVYNVQFFNYQKYVSTG
jgi:hypothetical protein